MLNFSMGVLWSDLAILRHEKAQAVAATRNGGYAKSVPEHTRKRIVNNLRGVFRQCVRLQLNSCDRTIIKLERMEWQQCTYAELATNLERLEDDLEHDLKQENFFHYTKENVELINNIPQKWGAIFTAFRDVKPEAEAGIDCYAVGHNTACVFHMCRVAEIGLLAIGQERGVINVRGGKVPIEWGTWGDILDAIEPQIEKINQKSNGPERSGPVVLSGRFG